MGAETAAIANALLKDNRTGHYVIGPEYWDCIWDETIVKKKGGATVYDRPGAQYQNEGRDYSDRRFSAEMLGKMILELTRLIEKYNVIEWNTKATAKRLVDLLKEHRELIQTELDEVNAGLRDLKASDFLGPKERVRQRLKKLQEITGTGLDESPEVQAAFAKRF